MRQLGNCLIRMWWQIRNIARETVVEYRWPRKNDAFNIIFPCFSNGFLITWIEILYKNLTEKCLISLYICNIISQVSNIQIFYYQIWRQFKIDKHFRTGHDKVLIILTAYNYTRNELFDVWNMVYLKQPVDHYKNTVKILVSSPAAFAIF